jgi:hypothetical protein
MLGDGVEFFATTDHDFRSNFQPTINTLGASDLIGTITGQEITTFDYGHFNSWPLVQDFTKVNNGSVDFGGAAPDGRTIRRPASTARRRWTSSLTPTPRPGAPTPFR